jgi:hypothetical protein
MNSSHKKGKEGGKKFSRNLFFPESEEDRGGGTDGGSIPGTYFSE